MNDFPDSLEGLYSKEDTLLVSIIKTKRGLLSLMTFIDIDRCPSYKKMLSKNQIDLVDVEGITLKDHDWLREFEKSNKKKIPLINFQNGNYALKAYETTTTTFSIQKNNGPLKKESIPGILREGKGNYYFNIKLDSLENRWLVVRFAEEKNSLYINYSISLGEHTFTEYFKDYSKVKPESDTSSTFVSTLSYVLALRLFETPDLFDGFELKKTETSRSWVILIAKAISILLGIFMLMGLITSTVEYREKIEHYEKKYGINIGDFPISKYKQPLSLTPLAVFAVIALMAVFVIYFPNKLQMLFGQSLLDLDPWSAPKTFLSWLNASILMIPAAWVVVVSLGTTQEEMLGELERHDALYSGCIQAENEFLVSAKGFGINTEPKASNRTDKYNSMLETVNFRYKHLAALVSMSSEGWAEFKHFAQLDYAHKRTKELYDALVSKHSEYQKIFGNFRRYG
ncbi:MAG: hypothetical protein GC192_21445 [Bacteroidetes bacterium]|nr:hypothetical protein [Bacteroidota bacterium]